MKKITTTILAGFALVYSFCQPNSSNEILIRQDTAILKSKE